MTLLACSPVEFPRTAYVARPAQVSVGAGLAYTGTHVSMAYESAARSGTVSGDGGNIVGPSSSAAGVAWIGMPEGALALGVIPGCELGTSLRLGAIHGEGRCQVIGYGAPKPVAFAVSAGGGAWLLGMGPYARLGVDATFAAGEHAFLLGLYARYGRRTHELRTSDVPADPDHEEGHCCELFPASGAVLSVEQTELRLSVPVGVALLAHQTPRNVTRLVLGIVPSFVLHASDRDLSCGDDCDPGLRVTAYDEELTLAGAVRLEWGATD